MGSGADSPCQGEMARRARGGRVGEYERGALILSRLRGRFGYFAAMGKVTRRPPAAKFPTKKRNRSIIAPSSAPFGGTFPLEGGRLMGGHMGPPLRHIKKRFRPFVGAGHRPVRSGFAPGALVRQRQAQ